jgi:hypothetical protein
MYIGIIWPDLCHTTKIEAIPKKLRDRIVCRPTEFGVVPYKIRVSCKQALYQLMKQAIC